MNKSVKRQIIDKWISKNNPQGLKKLAEKSTVSTRTIAGARLGVVPKSKLIRDALSNALEVKESELFPVSAEKTKAS